MAKGRLALGGKHPMQYMMMYVLYMCVPETQIHVLNAQSAATFWCMYSVYLLVILGV